MFGCVGGGACVLGGGLARGEREGGDVVVRVFFFFLFRTRGGGLWRNGCYRDDVPRESLVAVVHYV